MKRNAQYRNTVLIPIMVGILLTIAVRDAGAQSYVFDIGGWMKTIQHLVQEQKDRVNDSKQITVASIGGDDEDIITKVGDAKHSGGCSMQFSEFPGSC